MSDIDDKSYLLGVNLERERIIALLEEEYALAVECDFEIVQGLGVSIALIKGEDA